MFLLFEKKEDKKISRLQVQRKIFLMINPTKEGAGLYLCLVKSMKFTLITCLLLLAGFVELEARGMYSFFPCEKAYVESSQVAVSQDGISIQFQNGTLLTSTLYSDEQGFYFKDFKRRGDCSEGKWECQVCHYCNPNYNLYCGICWN